MYYRSKKNLTEKIFLVFLYYLLIFIYEGDLFRGLCASETFIYDFHNMHPELYFLWTQ